MKKSTIFKGILAGAAIGVGILCAPAGAAVLAYLGVSAAATTAGAVLWGGGGAIIGGIGGSIAGLIVSSPGLVHFFKKSKKALDKQGSDFFSNSNTFGSSAFSKMNLKINFDTAGQTATKKSAPSVSAPKNTPDLSL